MSRPPRMVAGLALCLVLVSCSLVGGDDADEESNSPASRLANADRSFESNDPVERGCAMDEEYLLRIWRGHDPAHSEDVTTVPLEPNYSGAFSVTSHSGPWDYLQNVPLVFYGPGFIRPQGEALPDEAGIVDVHPTVGELTGVDLPHRDGRLLSEILEPDRTGPPKLILTIVWDGVGRNVMERWPDSWPTVARMERRGASFLDAVVGSSPSITPATHSSLGTGAYPRKHGITAIEYRDATGKVRSSFAQRNPQDLELTTYADDIDLALGNAPLAGMVAWRNWHLGMLGHGSMTPGGDADLLGIIGDDEHISGNDDLYSTPDYLDRFSGLAERVDELDRSDGEADDEWMGEPIAAQHDNPAWVNYQTDVLLAVMEREGYGADDVPDMLFTNYKMTDIVGHQYTMDSSRMGEVLRAQDSALNRIVEYLDENVGDYVVVLSADHGHTPGARRSGAWPVLQGELLADVHRHFGTDDLIQTTTAAGPFLDREAMAAEGVTAAQVAEFLNGYTIRENWKDDELPVGYEERGNEPIFEAAFAAGQMDEIMRCKFGQKMPRS